MGTAGTGGGGPPLISVSPENCSNFRHLGMTFLAFVLHPEPTVRTELMEQVPQITIFLQESRPQFPKAFSEYLLPVLVRYLTDPNNQVSGYSIEWLFWGYVLSLASCYNLSGPFIRSCNLLSKGPWGNGWISIHHSHFPGICHQYSIDAVTPDIQN